MAPSFSIYTIIRAWPKRFLQKKQKRTVISLNEKELLRRLRSGETEALERVMDLYSAYVYAIVKNIIDPPLQPEDCEEVVSDVFLQLWHSAGDVQTGKLKSWLAAVTRNRAKDKLRSLHLALPMEDETLTIAVDGPEEKLELQELRELTSRAVDQLPEPERSIFRRHYFFYQKTEEIAAAMGLKPATVRTKLARGREKLKESLLRGGYRCEY